MALLPALAPIAGELLGKLIGGKRRRRGRGLPVMGKWPILQRPAMYRKGGSTGRARRGGHMIHELPFDKLKALAKLTGTTFHNVRSPTPGEWQFASPLPSMEFLRQYAPGALKMVGLGRRRVTRARGGMNPVRRRPTAAEKALGGLLYPAGGLLAPAGGSTGRRRRVAMQGHRGKGFLADLASGLPFVGTALGNLARSKGLGARMRGRRRGGNLVSHSALMRMADNAGPDVFDRVMDLLHQKGFQPMADGSRRRVRTVRGGRRRAHRGKGFLADLASGIPFFGKALSGLAEKRGLGMRHRVPAHVRMTRHGPVHVRGHMAAGARRRPASHHGKGFLDFLSGGARMRGRRDARGRFM